MTHAERRALREKHKGNTHIMEGKNLCDFCTDTAFIGRVELYPCDTIKVLDELERWIKE